jgi:hypothetical protein
MTKVSSQHKLTVQAFLTPFVSGQSPVGEVPDVLKNSSCSLWISMLEVYNENVYDLLAAIPKGQSAAKSNVKILSDGIGNFIPHGNVSTLK